MSWMSPLTVPITMDPSFGAPVSSKQRTQNEHAALHGVCSQQYFGDEQNAVAEVDTDDAHAFNQCLGQDIVWCPAAFQQDMYGFLDFLLQAIIKIVMHLQHKILVTEFGQDDFVVGHMAALSVPQI